MSIEEGRERKREGQERAASVHREWLDEAHAVAIDLASRGEFTADDVIAQVGLPCGKVSANENNVVGRLFSGLARGKQIEWTGRMVQSSRSENNAADLRVWEAYSGRAEREAAIKRILAEMAEPAESTKGFGTTRTKGEQSPLRYVKRLLAAGAGQP